MRVLRHYDEFPADLRGGAVALGNFDGVHLGHRAVIAAATEARRAVGPAAPLGVMTFEPHPRRLFQPEAPPFALSSLRTKARRIEDLGADFLYVQHFDRDFASHAPEWFVEVVLAQGLGVRHVVIGEDYHFGKGRTGDADLLRAMAGGLGFDVTTVPPELSPEGRTYSSTWAREAIQAGRVDEAATVLGHNWEVEGRVEHGDARGRTIGFPTANLRLGDYVAPAVGVYAVRAGIDRGLETLWYAGVANYGRRPTFDDTTPLLEVHLFDFDGDLYGHHLRVQMVAHLRPERKFDGLESLKAQIAADADQARRLLNAKG
ncbi:bifunctional riboflavin kinase/FAD synthetase [Roseospira marina]|uniref:Riboflavin biosynthesis protein n=1 Tax=Roseospira marina TaxID=140057 RepID=A0A5M6ID44_9PROT|nr:bifunctional riboflavin kinase/FAD synthetase [Roseospira marina]KAA5606201.1 bifunctional riboflavin kinase/FAD synthetase [Roseospira marina]MBB4314348.1 riboflavin kinase/FMN adenylyltransferase [Roseospira marina]MBB5087508.1 riboflavin kinase/FMN adenylyltransferase [Roseospira marina]